MPVPPPLVIETTASVESLIPLRYSRKTAGSAVGRPSRASRAWRWMIAAPDSTASMDWLTTSSTVYGRLADIVGVWADPVTAQVMMTLRGGDMASSCDRVSGSRDIRTMRAGVASCETVLRYGADVKTSRSRG